MRLGLRLICGAVLAAAPLCGSWAQDAAPFFKGKQIRILMSAGVAGGYNEYARLLAEHMGSHIDGTPDFIVQSMPGAGGLLATNYLFSQAPQDGTTIGLIHSTRAAGAPVRNQGRALRPAQVPLARQHRPLGRHVHGLAHVAGQDLGRHARARACRRQFRRWDRRWTSIRR